MRRFSAMTAFIFLSTIAHAQPATLPQFDAASVRVVPYAGAADMNSDAGRLDYRHINIKALVWVAFPITTYQIVWPRGLLGNVNFYDVQATYPPGTSKSQIQLMLQRLLAERFRLQTHWEMRESPVYLLKVAKSGPKISKSPNPPDDKTLSISVRSGPEGWSLQDRLQSSSPTAPFGITLSKLVQYLNNNFVFDRLVLDGTGLDGYYDINLRISAADTGGKLPDAEMFVDAIESQLGLTLEKHPAPVNTLVVDHIDTTPAPD
ncbi:MAG TPA: TIGR03435 family protein [Bryobacteraceae bacterium]|nr:TIGR03435 family protein [Bryobacteraceae bacterium]